MNMNPLILFDYVFYRISCFFGNVIRYEASKELNGITGLSFFQNLNLFTLINVFNLRLKNDKQYVIIFFLGFIILIGLNYFRYIKKNKYKKLDYIWKVENGFKKGLRDILVILYFLTSMMLMIII